MEKSTTQTATPVSLCWRWSRVTTVRYLMYVYCMFMTVCLYKDLKRLQKKISREVQKPCLQHFNLHAEFLHELATRFWTFSDSGVFGKVERAWIWDKLFVMFLMLWWERKWVFSRQDKEKKVSRSFGLSVSLYNLRHGSGCSFSSCWHWLHTPFLQL